MHLYFGSWRSGDMVGYYTIWIQVERVGRGMRGGGRAIEGQYTGSPSLLSIRVLCAPGACTASCPWIVLGDRMVLFAPNQRDPRPTPTPPRPYPLSCRSSAVCDFPGRLASPRSAAVHVIWRHSVSPIAVSTRHPANSPLISRGHVCHPPPAHHNHHSHTTTTTTRTPPQPPPPPPLLAL